MYLTVRFTGQAIIAAAICVVPLLVFAQGPPQGEGGRRRPLQGTARQQPRPGIGVETLDTDHDGTISALELKIAPMSILALDKNGDGRITADELRLPANRGNESAGFDKGKAVASLMEFDKNGDGKLSKDELPERMQGIFARADGNSDGFLTPAELRAVFDAQEVASQLNGRGDQNRAQMNPIQMDPILKALDADHDGSISAEEVRNAATALLILDKNGDGQLSPDEWRLPPPLEPRPEFRLQ